MNPLRPKEKDPEERRLSTDHRYSDHGVIVIDPVEGRLHDVDRKACNMLGYSREELLSMTGYATRPIEMSKLLTFARSVAERGFGWTSEFACTSRLGGVFTVEMSASVVNINHRGRHLNCKHTSQSAGAGKFNGPPIPLLSDRPGKGK